ncbi:cobalamin-dependent protein [Yoonia sp.]|uniref:cobalamin B12-binding domain-containing protein n=1 Tax=Yoonia sp. TaxID=2212373 RepID=UPI0019E7CA7F|nr:cobalamin-dependent protein [Yoonia sp.]MBE0413035.1 cobalamin B12-binding domain-containing protein [Yoonia sp.]
MVNARLNEDIFDRSEYERAGKQLRFVERTLPPDSVSLLAQEVVKRLAFRMPKSARSDRLTRPEDIDVFCNALLSSDEDAGARIVALAQRSGVNTQEIYLDYIVCAARRLGEMWEDDTASFIEVTLATGRLYRIVRGLRHLLAADITKDRDDCPVFFTLVPGDSHTLGIEIATDLFRRDGFEIDLAVDMSHDELVARSESRNYQVIMLVANSDGMLPALTRLIVALRITQPLAHVVVAGQILTHHPRIADITGVDAVIHRMDTAAATIKGLMAAE